MTQQDRQADREQRAREWFKSQYMVPPLELVEELAKLLASAEQRVLEEVASEAQKLADNLYCKSLEYCRSHCLGLHVIHNFKPDIQQEKLKELKHSEQLMGGHIHLWEHIRWLRQQAKERCG